jgi:phosphatidate phosphatase LPIN
VISDVDGTITKSDIFGQILPFVGKDWTQSGVAELYNNIKENNYHVLYLSARPIGQANITRDYIQKLKQGVNMMPLGPLLLSPNRLLSSFNQEVILRRPEEFKIACLRDIRSLFPANVSPFYAGFGNRPTVRNFFFFFLWIIDSFFLSSKGLCFLSCC